MGKRGRKSLNIKRTIKRFVVFSQLTENKNWLVIPGPMAWGQNQHTLTTGKQLKAWLEQRKAAAINPSLYEPAAAWDDLMGKLKTIGNGLVDVEIPAAPAAAQVPEPAQVPEMVPTTEAQG